MIIFALVLLGLVLLLGLAALVGGIVGLCLIRKKPLHRKGLATGLLITLLVVGALMMLLPVGVVSLALRASYPFEYTAEETDIIIEEAGYPGNTFTAGSVVYELLPFSTNFDYCFAHSEPVFTYTWKDILGWDNPGNLFMVENPQGFDLIWDSCDMLFCPAEQVDDVMIYYSSLENIRWTYYVSSWFDAEVTNAQNIPEANLDAIRCLSEIWCSPVEDAEIPDDTTDLWISGYIGDDIVAEISYTVALTDTRAYLVRREETDDWDSWVEYGISLPEDLFPIFESMLAYN